LSSLVFFTEIETEERLLPKLVRVLRDPDANVRKLALRLYEILNYYALPSHKAKFNKEILPLAIEVAKRDEDKEVRREALRVLTVTADETVAKLMVRMVVELPEDEYKTAIAANIWGSIVNSGLGLKFRNSLFKEFVSNTNQDVRRRIEEITQSHYPG
jgi:HEAT repeat protein